MADLLSHSLDVCDKPGLLYRILFELAGDGFISLEGDLSRCQFDEELVVAREECGLLMRNTLSPRLDFVVLRLTPEAVKPVFQQMSAAGLSRSIIHIQIERDGVLEFGAYDNFYAGCVVTGASVSLTLLEELKAKKIIRGYVAVDDGTNL